MASFNNTFVFYTLLLPLLMVTKSMHAFQTRIHTIGRNNNDYASASDLMSVATDTTTVTPSSNRRSQQVVAHELYETIDRFMLLMDSSPPSNNLEKIRALAKEHNDIVHKLYGTDATAAAAAAAPAAVSPAASSVYMESSTYTQPNTKESKDKSPELVNNDTYAMESKQEVKQTSTVNPTKQVVAKQTSMVNPPKQDYGSRMAVPGSKTTTTTANKASNSPSRPLSSPNAAPAAPAASTGSKTSKTQSPTPVATKPIEVTTPITKGRKWVQLNPDF